MGEADWVIWVVLVTLGGVLLGILIALGVELRRRWFVLLLA